MVAPLVVVAFQTTIHILGQTCVQATKTSRPNLSRGLDFKLTPDGHRRNAITNWSFYSPISDAQDISLKLNMSPQLQREIIYQKGFALVRMMTECDRAVTWDIWFSSYHLSEMAAPVPLPDFGDDDHYVKTVLTKITPAEDPPSLRDLTNATRLVSDLLMPHGTHIIRI